MKDVVALVIAIIIFGSILAVCGVVVAYHVRETRAFQLQLECAKHTTVSDFCKDLKP